MRSTGFAIQSILDSDQYKFSMQQAVLECFPNSNAVWRFYDRNGNIPFTPSFIAKLEDGIHKMSSLSLHTDERLWIQGKPFFKPQYVEYLSGYRFDPNQIQIKRLPNDKADITCAAPTHSGILWEVPLLALISETYYDYKQEQPNNTQMGAFVDRTEAKRKALEAMGITFSELGTRRRRSFDAHITALQELKKASNFMGTSNCYLAMKCGVRSMGTMAHEWIMLNSALCGLRHANRFAMDNWSKVYRGENGIALPDTFGTDAFLEDFDTFNAKLFDGPRHDSGNPFVFIDKFVEHYKKLRINPQNKTIIFSDGLKLDNIRAIHEHCIGKINDGYGVGTFFTNDFPEISKPLNIVMKLDSVNGIPVVKLSDVATKAVGDKDAVRVARWTFNKTPLDA